ncbi:MAG: aminoglycoside phosphotransferase family protein [Lewinellaceae bacterium]|nr:aminoglycoside phosphotransferase family protein [Lewinellaceae bacterium]
MGKPITDLATLAIGFGLPAEGLNFQALGGGHINDTWLVGSSEGSKIVLQRINTTVFRHPEQVVANHLRVFEHLQTQPTGLALLAPRAWQNGAFYTYDPAGHFWRACDFIPQTFGCEQAESLDQISATGQVFGRFLRGLITLSPVDVFTTIPHFHNAIRRSRALADAAFQGLPQRCREAAPELAYIRAEQSLFVFLTRLPLPERVVHNDAKIANVLFSQDSRQPCAVIDWDTIMPGSILCDFGDMVRSLVTTAAEDEPDPAKIHLDEERFAALVKGFIPEMRDALAPVEGKHLLLGAHWIILEQAIRFLADYLLGDPYYKTAYADHNLVRARNQLCLYRELRSKAPVLQRILDAV